MRPSPVIGIVFLLFASGCLSAVGYLTGYHLVAPPLTLKKPNFTQYEDVDEKKRAFFQFLAPMIQDQNKRILATRARVQAIQSEWQETAALSSRSQYFLEMMQQTYQLQEEDLATEALINRLLRRVDIVPVPLALAQAASESGWGTSRFAQSANNFFGQWCYQEGCGIVPMRRADGAQHEVADFSNVRESINAYFLNLNTYHAYKEFRAQRERVRQNGQQPRAADLIPTLLNYSERREAYLADLHQIIRGNRLSRFTQREDS